MEKMMFKKLFTVLIFCGLILTANAPVHAIIIELLPAIQEVETNTPVNVDLAISDLGDATAPSLGSFDLDITYDPTILALSGTNGLSFGDQLDLFGLGSLQSFDDSTPGTINLYEISLDLPGDLNSLQQSSFTLATLTFDTLLEGMTSLSVAVNALGDAYGDPLTTEVSAAELSVINTEVPEPTSLLLLAIGLVGFAWTKSTRQS
jgi:hypothetical protein